MKTKKSAFYVGIVQFLWGNNYRQHGRGGGGGGPRKEPGLKGLGQVMGVLYSQHNT